ncbi:MAG: hypothetical protein ACJARE_003731 [Paracoccaceae bacterium]|jgi:hypothetical protein
MAPCPGNRSIDGLNGGALAGDNHQMGALIISAEGDFGLGGIHRKKDTSRANDYTAFTVDWTAHIRGRLGYAMAPTLIIAAGGGVDITNVGWTIGGGAEHALFAMLVLRAAPHARSPARSHAVLRAVLRARSRAVLCAVLRALAQDAAAR